MQNAVIDMKNEEERAVNRHREKLSRMDLDRDRRLDEMDRQVCYVMSCCVMSSHIMSCHALSCHVISCHVMSYHVMSYPVMSCHVM